MSERSGASALLVFPPQSMIMGGQLRPEMAYAHFGAICEATDLPLIVFQYPMASGLGYPFDTLMNLVERFPQIRAIKDWCSDPALHERHIRALQGRERPVNVLTTHSAWLLGSLTMGPNGLLSGAGSVVADLQVAMFEAVQADDLAGARAVNERYVHMAQVFYAAPFLDMHNRMKECLALLGRIDQAIVRPPLAKLAEAEIARLGEALRAAGIEREGAIPVAA
jgi:4-hydroxy-tetrahydrodipicolinate synthase